MTIERGDRVWSVAVDGNGLPVNGGMVVDVGLVDELPFYEVLCEDPRQRVFVRRLGGNTEREAPRIVHFLRMFDHWSNSPERRIDPARTEPLREADGYANTARIEKTVQKAMQSAALAPPDEMFRFVVVAGEMLELRNELIAERERRTDAAVEDFNAELEERRRAKAEAQ